MAQHEVSVTFESARAQVKKLIEGRYRNGPKWVRDGTVSECSLAEQIGRLLYVESIMDELFESPGGGVSGSLFRPREFKVTLIRETENQNTYNQK